MNQSGPTDNMPIRVNVHGCELSGDQIERMETVVHTLRKLVADFPVAELQVP